MENKDKKEVLCDCGHIATSNGITTGYGTDKDGKKHCYTCCGEQDKAKLRESGKLSGYLTKEGDSYYFCNWPNSFRIRAYWFRKSYNNFAGRNSRTDVYFKFEGVEYWGFHVGHSHECINIRKVKN